MPRTGASSAAANVPTQRTRKPRTTAPAAVETETEVYTITLEKGATTKNYQIFEFPASSGCVGKLYVPIGTDVCKVRLEGAAK